MLDFDSLLSQLADRADVGESPDAWPTESFRDLATAGVLGWMIPREFGGSDRPSVELLRGYDRLATACLLTTFILTQRNGACQRIAAAEENPEIRQSLLPNLVSDRRFATVGISHLTTSRQHLRRPAVTVSRDGDDFLLEGEIPWVTGAIHADTVVTGGVLDDGRQVLIALPMDAAGITCLPPARLLALTGSCTGSVELNRVRVPARTLLGGPAAEIMKRGQTGGTGSVSTSVLAMGLSERAIRLLENEAERRSDLEEVAGSFRRELDTLRTDLYATVETPLTGTEPDAASYGVAQTLTRCQPESIRQRANSLVLRSTQSLMAASKGAGFVSGHPAERAAREAMFFLVWSCPQPVVSAALREFACLAE